MKRLPHRLALAHGLGLIVLVPAVPSGQDAGFSESFFARLAWRNSVRSGPARGRTAIAVPEAPPTVSPLHLLRGPRERRRLEDDEQRDDVPAGVRRPALALDWRDRRGPVRREDGLGRHRRGLSGAQFVFGDACTKSLDAGRTWAHMGLRESHHVSRILIHPKNPNRVYVAAMGHLYSPTPSAGSSSPRTAARRGRSPCTSTRGPASSTP